MVKIKLDKSNINPTFSIQESSKAKLFLGNIESIVEIMHGVIFAKFVVLNEVGPAI